MPKYNREKLGRGEYVGEVFRESVGGENGQTKAAEHGLGAGLLSSLGSPGCARESVYEGALR